MKGRPTLRFSSMGSAGCLTTKTLGDMARKRTAMKELAEAGLTMCTKYASEVRLHHVDAGSQGGRHGRDTRDSGSPL